MKKRTEKLAWAAEPATKPGPMGVDGEKRWRAGKPPLGGGCLYNCAGVDWPGLQNDAGRCRDLGTTLLGGGAKSALLRWRASGVASERWKEASVPLSGATTATTMMGRVEGRSGSSGCPRRMLEYGEVSRERGSAATDCEGRKKWTALPRRRGASTRAITKLGRADTPAPQGERVPQTGAEPSSQVRSGHVGSGQGQ